MYLAGCCVYLSIGGHLRPRQNLLFSRNDATASTIIINVLRSFSPDYIPSIVPTLGWLLFPPIHWKPSKIKALLLSLFFTLLYLTSPNDGQMSSPTRSALSHCLSNVPPSTEIIVRLVVAFLHRMAATQDPRSLHLSIFCWVPLGRPNQAIPPQRARARATGACNGLKGSRGTAIRAHGGWFHGEGGRSRGG